MKVLRCNEVCGISCNHSVKASSKFEAIRAMLLHNRISHRDIWGDMNDKRKQKMVGKMKGLLRGA